MFINGNSSYKQETVEQVRSRTSRNDVSVKHDGRGKAGGRELFWRKRSRSLCRSSAWFVEIVAAVMFAVSAMISADRGGYEARASAGVILGMPSINIFSV